MSKKPAKPKPQKKPAARGHTTVALYGLDEDNKPRAARFIDENEALLTKAAAAMGMRLAIFQTTPNGTNDTRMLPRPSCRR